jgi:ABC-type multidrug transport system fused ATPase/permease subunit
VLTSLLRTYRTEWRRIGVLTVLGVAAAVAEAAAILALAPMMQATAEGSDVYVGDLGPARVEISLASLAGVSAVLILISVAFQLVLSYLIARLGTNAAYRQKLRLTKALERASWEAQSREDPGELVVVVDGYTLRYAQGLTQLSLLLRSGAALAVFVAGALLVSPAAAGGVVLGMGAVFFLLRPIPRITERVEKKASELQVEGAAAISEVSATLREAAAFGSTRALTEPYRQIAAQHRRVLGRSQFLASLPAPLYRGAGMLLLVGLVLFVAQSGRIEVAAVGAIVLLLYRSLTYGQTVASSLQKLASIPPYADHLSALIRRLEAEPRRSGSIEKQEFDILSVNEVTYTYPGSSTPALTRASLTVRRGEIVGLVGRSGAGKSTLAELLLALREPDSGTVTLDGVELRTLSDSSTSTLTALVSQAVPLVNGTIRQNVSFFRPFSDAAVDKALDRAGLSDWLSSLPDGADTVVGGTNRSLSGGQRQRIGIARAIVGSPSLVVLDEPTSALDAIAEETITKLIGELRHDAAVVVIAHRLSTLRHCDRVVVLEDGRITDTGSLAELRDRNPFVDHAMTTGSLGT